jgi:hypothetical protein
MQLFRAGVFNRLVSVWIRRVKGFQARKAAVANRLNHNSSYDARRWKVNWGRRGLRCFIALRLFFGSLEVVIAGTTYYVATNGAIENSGLSTNSAWPLSYALANVGPSNTIVVMPGIWSNADWEIRQPYTTFQSQVKWGAVLLNGNPFAGLVLDTSNITVDGFVIAYVTNHGIYAEAPNITIRNCWIHHCANNTGIVASGILNTYQSNTVVENNLIEYVGNSACSKWDHGMYLSGTNIIVRNNVCRYNVGAGIQIWDNTGTGSTNVQIYNNLSYGNGRWGLVAGSELGSVYISVVGNTFICSNNAMAAGSSGLSWLTCTNNILLGGRFTMNLFGGSYNIMGDYNLLNIIDNLPLGAHGILTNYAGFVNTNDGLYWLTATTLARRAAFAAACGGTDFFGNAQSSVSDIGAFQYTAALTLDTRSLDPSPVSPNYWQNLTAPLPPTDLHVVPGSTQ